MERVIHPNITLYPVWRGGFGTSPLSLICTLSGFYPDRLSVEWLLDSDAMETAQTPKKLQSVNGEGKTFTLSSQIELDMETWTKGPNVSCKSSQNEFTRSISICSSKYDYICHITYKHMKDNVKKNAPQDQFVTFSKRCLKNKHTLNSDFWAKHFNLTCSIIMHQLKERQFLICSLQYVFSFFSVIVLLIFPVCFFPFLALHCVEMYI